MSQQQCYFCFQPWLSMWKFLLNSGIILTRWSHETYRFCEFERQKCLPVFITWWRMSSHKYIISPRFSCPVSSLSIMSFPICCWRCRDAVRIERQSDSLFCAGPFESTPPLLINCAAVCKSEKGLPWRNSNRASVYLFLSNLVISVMAAKTEAAQVNWTLRRWFCGEQATYDPSKIAVRI